MKIKCLRVENYYFFHHPQDENVNRQPSLNQGNAIKPIKINLNPS